VQGGKPAKPNVVHFIRRDGTVEDVPPADFSKVYKGDICEVFATGGGGYGDPYLRSVERVLEDVRNEVVSIQSARDDYGVVIDPETMKVDEQATAKLRGAKVGRGDS